MWRIGDDNIAVWSRLCSPCGGLVSVNRFVITFINF